jgi:hypothetical protein
MASSGCVSPKFFASIECDSAERAGARLVSESVAATSAAGVAEVLSEP